MKLLFTVFISCLVGFTFQTSFAIDYKEGIEVNSSPIDQNSDSNISRAKLLCNHVDNFDNNIENIIGKYGLSSDTIQKTKTLITKMQQACDIIQTKDIEKKDASEIITSIVTDLSQLNKGIKIYLKEAISDIEAYHELYAQGANKIAIKIDHLTQKIKNTILIKNTISSRDKEILEHIEKLEKTSKTLKSFGNLEFYKKEEIRASLIRIIRDIRSEISIIRDL